MGTYRKKPPKTKPKFSPGDRVRVIKYGSLGWESLSMNPKNNTSFPTYAEIDGMRYFDHSPHLVGKEGTVQYSTLTQNKHYYCLTGIPGKVAWYHEEQLEKIHH